MRMLIMELRKEKRTGIVPLMLTVGILGTLYAFVFFSVRKDTLLHLPLAPMDILLTQVYGMIMIFNMFGIIVAASIIYNMEFKGSGIKKMYVLPTSVSALFLRKFLILTVLLWGAVCFQNMALGVIGIKDLPQGTFDMGILVSFAGYSFLTSMPVLSFMVLVSSRYENMWVPLGIGVTGFLSGMALVSTDMTVFLVHPFVIMLKPAVAMSAYPDKKIIIFSLAETIICLCMGLVFAKTKQYE